MGCYERPDLESFIATAKQRNLGTHAGCYVDRTAGAIWSPPDIRAGEVASALRQTARVQIAPDRESHPPVGRL